MDDIEKAKQKLNKENVVWKEVNDFENKEEQMKILKENNMRM